MINFEEFKKVDLRVVKILEAERVPGSEKLLKLKVDLGGEPQETRQIIAGIGKNHTPEDLLNKDILIVANLEPRIILTLESQGMVLAANGNNGPVLLHPEEEIPPGSPLH